MKKRQEKKAPDKKLVPLTEKQQSGIASRQQMMEVARGDYGTYLQGILDGAAIEGNWRLVGIEDGKLVLSKAEPPEDGPKDV